MIALLIDKNSILRSGFHSVLTKNFEKIDILEAESVDSIKDPRGNIIPDLIVFAQQGQDGKIDESQLVVLRSLFKRSAIVVCDFMLDVNTIRSYFKLGVNGCISRKVMVNEFLKCVQHVLDDKRFIGEEFQELILSDFFVVPKKNNTPNVRSKRALTAREKQIAVFLSEGRGTSWIARKLEKKPSTISTIKFNIFKKLSIDNVIKLHDFIKQEE